MRDVQTSVGGKGATAGAMANPELNVNTFDAIVERGKTYADKLDNAEGILYEAPNAKNLTFVVFEQDAVFDPTTKVKISGRKTVRVRFENGFYLLDKKSKDFKRILTFLEGDGEENPPHHGFNRVFWRVEEAARNLREKALDQAVQLVVSSKDKNLAQSLIDRLQATIDVQIAPEATTDSAPKDAPQGAAPKGRGRGRAA